jgi:hypothetical protein
LAETAVAKFVELPEEKVVGEEVSQGRVARQVLDAKVGVWFLCISSKLNG